MEPSRVQKTYESSQLSSAIRSALKRRTARSFAFYTQLAPKRSPNGPLVLEKDALKLGSAREWLRLLACVGASAARHTNEWFRRIWPQFSSTNPTKVHFDLQVRHCIAINSTITRHAAYNDESSVLQNPRFGDASRVTRGH